MDFLKRFISPRTRDGQVSGHSSSFSDLSDEQLETHLKISRYGDFVLTGAIRPSYDLQVVPQAGFRHDTYHDNETSVDIPVLMAAASREQVVDLFLDLLDPLGQQVDVVLETSHRHHSGGHDDLCRECIDLPVLKSVLYEYEDLLLEDGCTGVAVLNPRIPLEVQFDEHKIFALYGQDQDEFEEILVRHKLPCSEEIKFITEAEHVHSSSDEFIERFEQLCYRLGIDS